VAFFLIYPIIDLPYLKEKTMPSTTIARGNAISTFYIQPSLTPGAVTSTSSNQSFTIPGLQLTDEVSVIGYVGTQTSGIAYAECDVTAVNTLQIQFGSGTTSDSDEIIIPNPDNIGIGLPFEQTKLTTAYAPSNFLFTDTYGIAPSNTTLTVTYLKGGGATSNIPSNTLTKKIGGNTTFAGTGLDPAMQTTVLNSLAFTNDNAAIGGGDGDTNEEIRQNSLAMYPTQLRTITADDYIIRTLSLPSKFGLISKAYPTQDMGISVNYPTDLLATQNPNAISLYILSKDTNNHLTVSSLALKQNLQTFLSEYRMLTDGVTIKDAFIINIGVNFDIIVRPNYNGKLVLNNCLTLLQSYFNIDKWQINQPIILSDIYSNLDQVDGVQTVQNVEIVNKAGTNSGYSQYSYDIKGATINKIIYPSLDPSIFEVKNLTTDIQGRCVTF
jgi:hypothetical protein